MILAGIAGTKKAIKKIFISKLMNNESKISDIGKYCTHKEPM